MGLEPKKQSGVGEGLGVCRARTEGMSSGDHCHTRKMSRQIYAQKIGTGFF